MENKHQFPDDKPSHDTIVEDDHPMPSQQMVQEDMKKPTTKVVVAATMAVHHY